MNRRGAIFVVFLFAIPALFLFLIGALELTRTILEMERSKTRTDTTVLSSLRIRAKNLELIADRWGKFGTELGTIDGNGVFLEQSKWASFAKEAEKLSGALSGYQARVSAVVTVMAAAYSVPREELLILDTQPPKMGLLSQPLLLRDESNNQKLIPAGWYKRTWNVDPNSDPVGVLQHSYRNIVSRGRLYWDADRNHPSLRQHGNGGYPSDWESAILENRLQPNRAPVNRADLVE